MPFSPGQRPEPFENTKRVVNKVKDVFDGKTDYEKRKKLTRKLDRLKGDTSKKAKEKRSSLKAELKAISPEKARAARLKDIPKLKSTEQVRWKNSSEYIKDSFTVDTPAYSAPVKVKEGHLGSFTDVDLASASADRYSRMDGGGDVMKESGLQLHEIDTEVRDSKRTDRVRKMLTASGVYGKVGLEQIAGGYVLESEELGKQYNKLSRIYVYDREDGLVDVSDATGGEPRTYKDLTAFLKRQNVNLPPRPISAPKERSALNGLVKNRVEYAEREDGAIVGRGAGMSDAPVAVLLTKGKAPEYHYSIRYRDTDQLIFDNLEDLLDFHSQKTGYRRDLLKLKFSPS